MVRLVVLGGSFILGAEEAFSQSADGVETWEVPRSISIMDNSFLIEEAFNQEARVVQHITNFQYFPGSDRRYAFAFTQEWPMWGVSHQFSYQLFYAGISGGSIEGIGDAMLNYRYQLCNMASGVAVAPRFSVILPIGDAAKELGMGVAGYEVCIPASRRFSESIVAHVNAIATLFPNVKATDAQGAEVRRTLPLYTFGGSIIWLFNPNANFMFEFLHKESDELDEFGEPSFTGETIMNPGMRAAINLEGLQIVPGLSVPVRFNDSGTEAGVFLYLSFEHGF